MLRFFLVCLMVFGSYFAQSAPPLYPFQNSVRSLSVDEGVTLIKKLGYPGIGSVYPQDLASYQAACNKVGLKVFSIYCSAKVHGTGYTYDAKISTAISLLKGTDAIVELNVQRGDDPQEAHAIALVKQVAADAKAAGLKVILYPHANDFIERVDHALHIAKATGCDNVGVAFNLCHFLKVQPKDDLTKILSTTKDKLWSVSLCGADIDGKDWNTLIRPLDEGTFDQTTFLRLLSNQGYSGAIGLQCFGICLTPRQHLSRSWHAWKKLHSETKF
jgi:sugar phosphate isomerase/epimerase